MQSLLPFAPQLAAMAALLVCSAFFSGSEAALFYLRREDRHVMSSGRPGQRMAAKLLSSPDRLLSAILFWNLLVNLTYFALTSAVALRLEREGARTEAGAFSVAALLVIILLGEMLPKNLAVLRPKLLAGMVGRPLTMAVRALDRVMPALRMANLASRRLLFPQFEREPYLDLGDLERAITLGTQDQHLVQHERAVLQNIVALDNVQVEEIMRPRLRFELFRPPVHLADLRSRAGLGDFVFISEHDSDEIAAAVPLKYMAEIPAEHLEHHAEKVVYVPWSASVASALEELRRLDREVAAVIDEHGGTIGIVTVDDILATVIRPEPGAGDHAVRPTSVVEVEPGVWIVTGMTSLRRLSKRLGVTFPEAKSVTVAGMVHEELQRLPEMGDVVHWGGFQVTVIKAPARGRLTVRFEREPAQEEGA